MHFGLVWAVFSQSLIFERFFGLCFYFRKVRRIEGKCPAGDLIRGSSSTTSILPLLHFGHCPESKPVSLMIISALVSFALGLASSSISGFCSGSNCKSIFRWVMGLKLIQIALPVFAFKPSIHRCIENKKQNEIFMKKSLVLPS